MGKLILLDCYRQPWRLVVKVDTAQSTIQIYVNDATGEVEFVQHNDEGEAIRTVIGQSDFSKLVAATSQQKPVA